MSALDIPLVMTRFEDVSARTCTRVTTTLRELAGQIGTITAPSKTGLPLVKLAAFGNHRTRRGSLRSDRNLHEITGVEIEHDAQTVPLEAMAAALHAARIPAFLYTTPSHRPDGPKWRGLIPTSKALPPVERARLVSRIAGALPPTIALSPESWTLSQAYFLGHALDAAEFRVLLVDGDDYPPIDLRTDLDARARGKPRPERKAGNGFDPGPVDDADEPDLSGFDAGELPSFDFDIAREIILHGHDGQHDAMRGMAWALATHDLPEQVILTQICDLYQLRPEVARDERWQRDWKDIPRTIRSAIEKLEALRHPANGSGNGADPYDPWAQPAEPDLPDPLIAPSQPQAPYPFDQLPTSFAETVRAVARATEADPSLAGTVALAAMATATAKLAIGVEVEEGLVFPISLYTADIVGSSERKTTAEKRVCAGIHAVVNDELVPEYQLQRKQYNAELAIYERDKRSILSQRKKAKDSDPADDAPGFDAGGENGGDTLAALMGLREPLAPKQPYIVTNDFTIEGMRDALAENSGQLAVVTSEGAVMFNGYSLGDKTRRGASVGALSRYWDGLDETVTRAHGRVITIHEPRVSLSIGVQPRIASTFFADLDLRDQGIVNRFLITWPAPLAGTRSLDPPRHEDLEVIRRFNAAAQHCLRIAHGLTPDSAVGGVTGQAQPRAALTLSPDASVAWRTYAKQIERQQGKDEPYEHITGWAGKAAEQAARIAVIATLFADPQAQTVELTAMQAGITLATWYCDEWLRICEVVEPSPELNRAHRVLEWVRATYGGKTASDGKPVTFTARDLYSAKAAGIVTRAKADEALSTLSQHGYIKTSDPPKPKRVGRPPLVKWQLAGDSL